MCGTSIGAFIAILLGRYGLDSLRCKQLYMDLAIFIRDRKRMRHSDDLDASIGRGSIENFMKMSTREEGCSEQMKVPILEGRLRCQHVFVMHNHKPYGAKFPNMVHHGGVHPRRETRRFSPPTASLAFSVSAATSACVAHGFNRWVSEAGLDLEEHSDSQIHGIVLSKIDEF